MYILYLWKGMKTKKFDQKWPEEVPEEKMGIFIIKTTWNLFQTKDKWMTLVPWGQEEA